MAFYVGQKVEALFESKSLEKGRVYTVAKITSLSRNYRCGRTGGVASHGIVVQEVDPDRCSIDGALIGFSPYVFRPLVERKTDISIFKAMLNPSKTEVTA